MKPLLNQTTPSFAILPAAVCIAGVLFASTTADHAAAAAGPDFRQLRQNSLAFPVIRTLPASSTDIAEVIGEDPEMLMNSVLELVSSARHMDFEPGYESEFSRELSRWLVLHRSRGLDVLSPLLLEAQHPDVSWEGLRVIARTESLPLNERLWWLIRALSSPSPMVRDGALLGLADIDHPKPLPYLRDALRKETNPALRHEIRAVISQLEDTSLAATRQNYPQSHRVES